MWPCLHRRWLHGGFHSLHDTAHCTDPSVGACAYGTPTADDPALDASGSQLGRGAISTVHPWAVFTGERVCFFHPHHLRFAPPIWSGRPSSMSGSPPSSRCANTRPARRGSMISPSALASWGGRG